MRSCLQRLGEVNLMAIEEYETLEKRETFLTTQYKDLQSARETLLGVIARSDKKILAMFMETFTLVADHFRNYFRTMFNGGQARIYLLDEDDPLESGIEIEARPPGKKPQSISLLSGGEQAMTALALLFAIFRAKPSPFCILDEVDAPLDDANIGRFLSMLTASPTRASLWSSRTTNRPWRAETPSTASRCRNAASPRTSRSGSKTAGKPPIPPRDQPDSDTPSRPGASRVPGRE